MTTYMRPEADFVSMEVLKEAIWTDVRTAEKVLEEDAELTALRGDAFFDGTVIEAAEAAAMIAAEAVQQAKAEAAEAAAAAAAAAAAGGGEGGGGGDRGAAGEAAGGAKEEGVEADGKANM